MGDRHRPSTFHSGFQGTTLIFLANFVAVLVREMDLHARDAITGWTEGFLHNSAHLSSHGLMTRHIVIRVDLDLHGALLTFRFHRIQADRFLLDHPPPVNHPLLNPPRSCERGDPSLAAWKQLDLHPQFPMR